MHACHGRWPVNDVLAVQEGHSRQQGDLSGSRGWETIGGFGLGGPGLRSSGSKAVAVAGSAVSGSRVQAT